MFNDSLKCCLLFKKAFNLWLFGSGVFFFLSLLCFVSFFFFRKLSSNWKYLFQTCLLENR